MHSQSARLYPLLSIAAAIITIALKTLAYFLTGSVGLLSEALESIINLVTAVFAFWALAYASRPPDEQHPFGHYKAEYFSSGLESTLIVIAAIGIAISAIHRLFQPEPLEQLGLGLAISLIATVINGLVALILLRASKRFRSITLRADAQHLLADVWTSVGVVIGVALVKLTGWLPLDSIVALLVAVNILREGLHVLTETAPGILDSAISTSDRQKIQGLLISFEAQGVQFHALRTRQAGSKQFVSLHVLVPGNWSVQDGHDLCEKVELAIACKLPGTYVITHLEPLEDPRSWADEKLDHQLDCS
jgi:cation diffusion facilitator family transporter